MNNCLYLSEEKKEQYWTHFSEAKKYHPKSLTDNRLAKIKEIVWADYFFWQDILVRHNGIQMSPEEMERDEPAAYDHCMGNMMGMIMEWLTRKGIIR